MAHHYGDPCATCGNPANDYNVAKCTDCCATEEHEGADPLSRLYTPGKAHTLPDIREALATETPKPPAWEIHVSLSTTGVIRRAEILHHGRSKEGWVAAKFTDRTTLEEVVTWANRATRCDAELTSSHLKLF
jgi:hypothetical protein